MSDLGCFILGTLICIGLIFIARAITRVSYSLKTISIRFSEWNRR